jgi:hypothetical protein
MGLLQSLFGGSNSESSSTNKSYDFLKDALGPGIGAASGGINALAGELSGGFDDYKKKSGFNYQLGEDIKGITGGSAASGLLRSGPTAKGLARHITGFGNREYGNYLDRLGGLGQLGLGGAGVLAGAGQESKGEGSSSNGILSTLFSDPRVKEDVWPVGKLDNGLIVYMFRYIGMPQVHIGLMADEVEKIAPHAVHRAPWNGKGPLRGQLVRAVDYEAAARAPMEKEAA